MEPQKKIEKSFYELESVPMRNLAGILQSCIQQGFDFVTFQLTGIIEPKIMTGTNSAPILIGTLIISKNVSPTEIVDLIYAGHKIQMKGMVL